MILLDLYSSGCCVGFWSITFQIIILSFELLSMTASLPYLLFMDDGVLKLKSFYKLNVISTVNPPNDK